MRSLEAQIGSIHNLVVFEAAGRHLSFSRAAMELSVTQPAVSQALRKLEEAVGTRLFKRLHRAIALTEAGEQLHAEVVGGFARILAAVRQINLKSSARHVTILSSTAFATWWLVPRLAEFHRLNPGVDLRIETVDKDVPIERPTTTLAIRRGDGQWPGHSAAMVAEEILSVAASPAFLARHGSPTDLPTLAKLPLAHLDEPHRYRPNWQTFFSAMGYEWADAGDGLRLNDYALVLQAAMAGEGAVISWAHVTDWLCHQRLLVRLEPWQWKTGAGFHLVWRTDEALTRDAELTRAWILRVKDEPLGR